MSKIQCYSGQRSADCAKAEQDGQKIECGLAYKQGIHRHLGNIVHLCPYTSGTNAAEPAFFVAENKYNHQSGGKPAGKGQYKGGKTSGYKDKQTFYNGYGD